MDNFFGTWKQKDKAENMRALMDVTDVTDKEKDMMINQLFKFEISKNGDKYNMIYSCDESSLSKTYTFTLDEPLESTDLCDRKFKSTFKLVNPNLLTESCSEWTDGVINGTYEISGGDTMTWKIHYKELTSTIILKKVSS